MSGFFVSAIRMEMLELFSHKIPLYECWKSDQTTGDGVKMVSATDAHVLAVDDCLMDRKIIERLLKTDSFKVTTVESAARALEILGLNEEQQPKSACKTAFKFNMIITDYCMPGMTGYELLKKVKQTKGLNEIPVVIMSSEIVPQRIKRCLAEGAEDFLIKPVQLADVKKLRGHIKVPKPEGQDCRKGKMHCCSMLSKLFLLIARGL